MPRISREERIKLILDERKKLNKIYLILFIVSASFLFLTGFFTLAFSGHVFSKLSGTAENLKLTEMNVVMLGSAWLFLSYFVAMSAYRMKKKVTRHWIHLMLFFGILAFVSANFISGIILLAVSIKMLVQDIKLAKKIH